MRYNLKIHDKAKLRNDLETITLGANDVSKLVTATYLYLGDGPFLVYEDILKNDLHRLALTVQLGTIIAIQVPDYRAICFDIGTGKLDVARLNNIINYEYKFVEDLYYFEEMFKEGGFKMVTKELDNHKMLIEVST